MTPKEAIEMLRNTLIYIRGVRENDISTLQGMAIEALEKQIPKKPYISKGEYTINYKCPVCGCRFMSKIDDGYVAGNKYKHCYICGQAIEWNVTEDE